MPQYQQLLDRAAMFEDRADKARDPISRQHYREMAVHYRTLALEHLPSTREVVDARC
jgi:hypothetical protein